MTQAELRSPDLFNLRLLFLASPKWIARQLMKPPLSANDRASDSRKNPKYWPLIAMLVLGVGFALLGITQLLEGEASGKYNFAVSRATEPTLFWLYITAHFVVAAWIILVAIKKLRSG
jgi:hypothetical protein